MTEKLISVNDFASQHGLIKPTVFKVLKRLGIDAIKERGGKESRGQMVSYITEADGKRILEAVSTSSTSNNQPATAADATLYDIGVFYLLQLEPEHDPTRVKVGFTNNLDERIRKHKCSAPYTEVIGTWPCRRLWEKTAIECVTNGTEQLHTEVFRVDSVEDTHSKCNAFFSLMPKLNDSQDDT